MADELTGEDLRDLERRANRPCPGCGHLPAAHEGGRPATPLLCRDCPDGICYIWDGRPAAERTAEPTLGQYNLLKGRIGALEDENADLRASKDRVAAALTEARAEIAHLKAQAENLEGAVYDAQAGEAEARMGDDW